MFIIYNFTVLYVCKIVQSIIETFFYIKKCLQTKQRAHRCESKMQSIIINYETVLFFFKCQCIYLYSDSLYVLF